MNEAQVRTVQQVRQILAGTESLQFVVRLRSGKRQRKPCKRQGKRGKSAPIGLLSACRGCAKEKDSPIWPIHVRFAATRDHFDICCENGKILKP